MRQHELCSQRLQPRLEGHVVPVTALAYYNEDIVLAGEGSLLCAYSEKSQTLLGAWRVFRDQAIHGIVVDADNELILIFGGRWISIGSFNIAKEDYTEQVQHQIDDWILDASFRDGHAALITAHNALLSVQKHDQPDGVWSVVQRVPGSNTILYCAHIQTVAHDQWLIASGTAFGDVIVWSCHVRAGAVAATTHYSFSAHEGSTFGVHISNDIPEDMLGDCKRLLVSCSDDRSIRVWNISDLSKSIADDSFDRSTGFGTRSDDVTDQSRPALVAKAMGHVSRIWHVRFEEVASTMFIKSFGEDATTITWRLRADAHNWSFPSLTQVNAFNANAGKHLWSLAKCQDGRFIVGGSDGAIACVPAQDGEPEYEELELGSHTINGIKVHNRPKVYALLDNWLTLTNDSGCICHYQLEKSRAMAQPTLSCPDLLGYSVIAATSEVVCIAGNGTTVWVRSPVSLAQIVCGPGKTTALFACKVTNMSDPLGNCLTALLISKVNQAGVMLKLFYYAGASGHITIASDMRYALPDGFFVTASEHVRCQDNDLLSILGSRHGAVAIFKHNSSLSSETAVEALRVTCIHTEAITSLIWRSSTQESSQTLHGHVFSTSRDRTYAVHELRMDVDGHTFAVSRVHQLELPLGPNIGGMSILQDDQVLVWGFRTTHFVMYSVTSQRDVFTIDCGGAHRNYAVRPRDDGLTFVWTKAAKVFVKHLRRSMTRTVKTGSHGREVKSMAVKHQSDGSTLVATGAQDTDIRLSLVPAFNAEDKFCSTLNCIHVLRQHNTGPQHLAFSDDGEYLFSSGGFEEFFVWRLSQNCPVLGIGVVCESMHPRSGKSDLRIMGFEATPYPGTSKWHIAMAYSDSRVAIWSYQPLQGWEHLTEADYLTACPTSISSTHSLACYVTTATDGHLTMWKHQNMDDLSNLQWTMRHRAHQGAILCSATYALSNDSLLIATGGDDNAIALTVMKSFKTDLFTYSISRAHAAAVTAMAMTKLEAMGDQLLYLVSAGLDQRLILWELDIDACRARKLRVVTSDVADISSIGLLPTKSQASIRVIVSGIGSEIWDIPLLPIEEIPI